MMNRGKNFERITAHIIGQYSNKYWAYLKASNPHVKSISGISDITIESRPKFIIIITLKPHEEN